MRESPIIIPTLATPIDRLLSRFGRRQIEGFIAVAIDLLDLADGDSDIELNGDEHDHNNAEDDFCDHNGFGPGCPVSDPDCAVDDMRCDGDEGV